MKALLIIDMQKGSFTPQTPRYQSDVVINHINQLSGCFRKRKWPVIHIQHDGTSINAFLPGTGEWEILDEIHVEKSDLIVEKTANDAFYRTNLKETLDRLGVSELIITGCATDFCVESTVQSALTKDYGLTIVRDGHTTADRPHAAAKAVVDHYNWIWDNMIPTKGSIRVITASRVMEED